MAEVPAAAASASVPASASASGLDPAGGSGPDRIEVAARAHGLERLRARFGGRAFARHRHDTYTVCVTESGLQGFDYRGAAR